jgi:hypothetical protein
MDDVDEEKQVEIADDTTSKAEEKANKDNAPINKERCSCSWWKYT